ncbi:MAG: PRC-barrel domain-containing protein [Euryarchaeota archaeon]|nr:PRC-barrel domain-containing protein [Methanosarcinales archaeon]MEA1944650.1 PRC-barrel domain-containing protein [Euryarchaeota archaeon]RJS73161.1 MAG: photosystem reaction center subunit H [ANME-2 cluster archaeon]
MHAELTSLFGLNVYTDKGLYVGNVNDVVIEAADRKVTGLALNRINRELFDVTREGIILPYRWVLAIGDIVIVKQVNRLTKKNESE